MDVELVAYDIYDDNGDVYRVYVTERERVSLDGHSGNTLRMLNRIKAIGQKPIEKWDESLSMNAEADVSEWLPPPGRKGGKPSSKSSGTSAGSSGASAMSGPTRAVGEKGASWPKASVHKFLQLCIGYKDNLNCPTVPKKFWVHMSDIMFSMDPANLNYSWEMLRKKLKDLKNYYSNCKRGKFSGSGWEFYPEMENLFGTESVNISTCEPSVSHGLDDIYASRYRDIDFPNDLKGVEADGNNNVTDIPTIVGLESTSDEDLGITPLGEVTQLSETHEENNNISITSNARRGLHCSFNKLNIAPVLNDGNNNVIDGSSSDELQKSFNREMEKIFSYVENHKDSDELNPKKSDDLIPQNSDDSSHQNSDKSIHKNSDDSNHKKFEDLRTGSDDSDFDIEIVDDSFDMGSNDKCPSETDDGCTAARLMPLKMVRSWSRLRLETKHPSKEMNPNSTECGHLLSEDQQVKFPNHFHKLSVVSSTQTKTSPAVPGITVTNVLHQKEDGVLSDNITLLGETTFKNQVPSSSTPTGCRNVLVDRSTSSPAKKRTSAGFQFRSPSNRTPKRKVAASSLVWDADATKDFVEECLARKGDVQKDEVPVRVWKEIHAALQEKGETFPWEACRAKFHQMNNYFANKMLSVGGTLGGIKWPYYEQFCKINDVPLDFEPADDAARDIDLTPSKKRQIWVPDAERLLISLYSDLKSKFDGTHSAIRHNTLYNQVAATMQSYGVMVSGKQCKSHMDSLLSDFRKAFDAAQQTGAAAPTFPYYDRLLEIFGGSATLIAPVAVSVGRGLTYKVAGAAGGDSTRGTRTRTGNVSSSEDKPKKVSKRTLYKSWTQEIQERQLELKEKQNEEFRLMREGFEKRAEERTTMFKELIQMAKDKKG